MGASSRVEGSGPTTAQSSTREVDAGAEVALLHRALARGPAHGERGDGRARLAECMRPVRGPFPGAP
eukprot:996215-Pyramimonas_sp.AAC.1